MRQPTALLEALEDRRLLTAIHGFVHNDINGDGLANEVGGTPTVRVFLYPNVLTGVPPQPSDSVLTNAAGEFTFNNVLPGRYRVAAQPPAGWVATSRAGRNVQYITVASKDVWTPVMNFRYGRGPVGTVGQNAQHTGISPFSSQAITGVTPQALTDVDPTGTGRGAVGAPVVTKLNTVIVPVVRKNATTLKEEYVLEAHNRFSGTILWTFVSDYTPAEGTPAVFAPAIGADGKVYVPGAGGYVAVIASPDRKVTPHPTAMFPYTVASYRFHTADYNSNVFITTPLTVDDRGNVYYGISVNANAPSFITLRSGIVRANANGTHNQFRSPVVAGAAPALSSDQKSVYVMTAPTVKTGANASQVWPTLVRLQAVSLAKLKVVNLKDPASGQAVPLGKSGPVTGTPTVAPNGDVFVTVPADDANVKASGNGWLLHFNASLSKSMTPGLALVFQTPSIVPASMVSYYTGRSSYLVAVGAASTTQSGKPGVIAVLDPTDTETAGVQSAASKPITTMKTIYSAGAGDIGGSTVGSDIISTSTAVDVATQSLYVVSLTIQQIVNPDKTTREVGDESLVRLDLSRRDSLPQTRSLATSITSVTPNGPTFIGPDGEVYAYSDNVSGTTTLWVL